VAGDDRDTPFSPASAGSPANRNGNANGAFGFFSSATCFGSAGVWHAHAYALIVLQIGLAVLNIRGVAKNERA
jgi:hypothetical protein